MPSKTRPRVVVYIPSEILLDCKADAAALHMRFSEYVVAVLRQRFGLSEMKAPTRAVHLGAASPGTDRSSRDTGGTSAGARRGDGWVQALADRLGCAGMDWTCESCGAVNTHEDSECSCGEWRKTT